MSGRWLKLAARASVPLSWSYLQDLDPGALEEFACARGKRWEIDVERHIRELANLEPQEYALVGSDAFGPVVVISYYIDGPACKIMAVGTDKRAQQNRYGTEAVLHVVNLVRSGVYGSIDEIYGFIHRFNTRSKAMMRVSGFEFDSQYNENLESWALSI